MQITGKEMRLDRAMALRGDLGKSLRTIPGEEGKFRLMFSQASRSRGRLGALQETLVAVFKLVDRSSKNEDEWVYEELSSDFNPEEFARLRDIYYKEVNPYPAETRVIDERRRTGTGGRTAARDAFSKEEFDIPSDAQELKVDSVKGIPARGDVGQKPRTILRKRAM